jgi:hypothetical protein
MFKVALVSVGVFAALAPGSASAQPATKEIQEWRVLLIIKSETDLKLPDHPPIRVRIPSDNIAAVKKAFVKHTPYWVDKVSESRLRWKAEAVTSPTPVTAVTEMGKGSYWLAPWNIPEDIKKFVKVGAYDGVFVYWKAVDDENQGINAGFGWSIGPNENANNCGYTCVHHGGTGLWERDTETTEVFLHEWLHQLEAFYGSKGIKLPKGGLHVDASYGYMHHPTMFWKPWYRDFIAGEVREPDGTMTGLGNKAWALGTIREEQQVYTPEYLIPELKKLNLLRDGSFEEAGAPAWTLGSWRGNRNAGHIARLKARDGKQVAVVDSDQSDDITYKQTVAIQPKTKYLFCGWAKTQNVTIAEKGGAAGANLSVLGGFERSPTSMTGSKDWTYLSFTFDAGDRTSIEVAVRLGHHGSTASGRAWFDDLCLIALGPSKGLPIANQ